MAQQIRSATISSRLVSALAETWAAVMARHPDVPEVVITLGSGTARRGRETYGHFAAARWRRGTGLLPEMFIGGEGLKRGERAVLGTLLHEAAHGMASSRGIRDTSNRGRYHNKQFLALARELGLEVARVPVLGWSEETVPGAIATLYQDQLRVLEAALVAFRLDEPPGPARARNDNSYTAHCRCPRRIEVARTVLAAGPIACGVCNARFEAAQ